VRTILIAALLSIVTLTSAAGPGKVLIGLPDDTDPRGTYLFYLHGRIAEGAGDGVEHPDFGVYEYDAILQTFADHGITVISEVRPRDADVEYFARKVAAQVETLINEGIRPSNIVVVGFSKGGAIAGDAARRIANPQVRYVLLGSCGVDAMVGQVRVIREASDDLVGPCDGLDETVLKLGGGHGAFYRPQAPWVDSIASWAGK